MLLRERGCLPRIRSKAIHMIEQAGRALLIGSSGDAGRPLDGYRAVRLDHQFPRKQVSLPIFGGRHDA
jgi:hypothetical protein